jgi:hydrogenase expression/formation protein HypE
MGMAITPIPVGKVPVDLLTRLLGDSGPMPGEVLLGPAVGEDACALDLPAGVLVVATDPITLTGRDIGHHAVIVNANDVAVMGVHPRWFLATILVPPGSTDAGIEELFAGVRRALREIGATLVGGHTEVTDAVVRPIVVGQMLGLAENRRFVSTAGIRPGDVIVQVGAAPVEGAAVLAVEAASRLHGVDPAVTAAAAAGVEVPGISIVDAALDAARLGATALHDPTEGGLAAGLHELAMAGGVRLRVDRARLLWFEPGLAVCRALGADPWATLASGSLLAAFDPARAAGAAEALAARGYAVAAIGTAAVGRGVDDTLDRAIPWPSRDEVSRLLTG